jgi:peptide-methionine (R)-S-oxide reductase
MSNSKPSRSASGFDLTPWTKVQIEEKAKTLTPEERRVLLNHGTEPAFCGGLLNNKSDGVYECRLCGLPLFRSKAKFESGTGWPSFYEPFDEDHIAHLEDNSYGMTRVEIRCARCDGHLGHVFEDGPHPTGLRYCLNSASLQFEDGDSVKQK